MDTGNRHRLRILIIDGELAAAYQPGRALPTDFELIAPPPDGNVLPYARIQTKPDIILIGVSAAMQDGGKAIKELSRDFPRARIILYPAGEKLDSLAADAVLHAAINVPLTDPGPQLPESSAHQNLPQAAADSSPTANCNPITSREHEVLALLAAGYAMKEIAYHLGITYRTVTFHKYRMMGRLGIKTNAGLMSYALQRNVKNDRTFAA